MMPPRPPFSALPSAARPAVFGYIAWKRASGDYITITNGWARENLVTVYLPQLRRELRVHRVAAAQLGRLWAAWEAAGLLSRVLTFDGLWVPRTIRGNPSVLSNHAYGTAFDINARWNPFYGRPAPAGAPGSVFDLVELANRHGFWWGGHWNYDGRGAADGMHFEWAVTR